MTSGRSMSRVTRLQHDFPPSTRCSTPDAAPATAAPKLARQAAYACGIDVAPRRSPTLRPLPPLAKYPISRLPRPLSPFAPSFLRLDHRVRSHRTPLGLAQLCWRKHAACSIPVVYFWSPHPIASYYAESRAQDGPNPYHVHEFEFQEFATALGEFFPQRPILCQNRIEAFAFHARITGAAVAVRVRTLRTTLPRKRHFFIGVCGCAPAEPSAVPLRPSRRQLLARTGTPHPPARTRAGQTKEWLDRTSPIIKNSRGA